nr:hypothetical protein [Morchella crassipes]
MLVTSSAHTSNLSPLHPGLPPTNLAPPSFHNMGIPPPNIKPSSAPPKSCAVSAQEGCCAAKGGGSPPGPPPLPLHGPTRPPFFQTCDPGSHVLRPSPSFP